MRSRAVSHTGSLGMRDPRPISGFVVRVAVSLGFSVPLPPGLLGPLPLRPSLVRGAAGVPAAVLPGHVLFDGDAGGGALVDDRIGADVVVAGGDLQLGELDDVPVANRELLSARMLPPAPP